MPICLRLAYALLLAALLRQPVLADTLNLADFIPAEKPADFHPVFARALAELAQTRYDTLNIPPGSYPLSSAGEDYHLTLRGLAGKRIAGQGATLLFQELKAGVLLERVQNLRIDGVTLNWATPPHVQGEILARHGLELRLKPDAAFAGAARTQLTGARRLWATLHATDGRRDTRLGSRVLSVTAVRLAGDGDELLIDLEPQAANALAEPGLKLVLLGRFRSEHAFTLLETTGVNLNGVSILASPGMGLLAHPGNRDLHLENLRITPDATRAAFISTNADGLHVLEPSGSLTITGNRLLGLQDDAIVVSRRGVWARRSASGKVLKVERAHASSPLASTARLEALVRGEGPRPLSKVAEFLPQKKGALDIELREPFTAGSEDACMVVFPGDSPARVEILRNEIVDVRARGIRINYPQVLVAHNRIAETTGAALLAGPFLGSDQWQPQYPPQGLMLRNNRFEALKMSRSGRIRSALVEIAPFPYSVRGRYGRVIRDVHVLDNEFVFSPATRSSLCAISIADADQVTIRGNRTRILPESDSGRTVGACGIDSANLGAADIRDNTLGPE